MDIKEGDTLKKYGVEFQNKCLTCLLTDRLFLERIFDILDSVYFETSAQKWVVEQIKEYYIQYKDYPSALVFATKVKEIDPQMKILSKSLLDLFEVVYDHMTASDLQYVKDQFIEFCKTRALAKAIYASVDYLNKGDYESIKTVVDNALRAGTERNLGHNYLVDIDKRMSLASRHCIKTGWENIDQLLDGGLGKGELGFILAPTGTGKTWVLSRLGAEALKQGKNILHITLELNEEYVGLRYDAYFSGISFQNIRKNADIVKKIIGTVTGKLFIKYFPMRSVSAMSIKLFVERLQLLEQIKIDLLIVDYADILKPTTPLLNSSKYDEAGSIYEELRAIAGELQIPVWSASQSNREGEKVNIVQGSNVSDSYRKNMTGDFVMSLSRKEEDTEEQTARVFVIKNRFGPDKIIFPCKFNADCGHIFIYDKASNEGKQLLEKMKTAEKNVKRITKTLWDEFSSKLPNNPAVD